MKKAVTVILYLALGAMLLLFAMAAVLYLYLGPDPLSKHFCGGALKYVFAATTALMLLLPIIFRRKIKNRLMLPAILIIALISSAAVNTVIYKAAESYISVYSRDKWDRNKSLRIYMTDDLEWRYELLGKSREDITALLGEPDEAFDRAGYKIMQYYAGDDGVDAIFYEIRFVDDRVIEAMSVHS